MSISTGLGRDSNPNRAGLTARYKRSSRSEVNIRHERNRDRSRVRGRRGRAAGVVRQRVLAVLASQQEVVAVANRTGAACFRRADFLGRDGSGAADLYVLLT